MNSTRRLRVLHLIDSAYGSGGAERFALGLAGNLPRDRFDVWLCSTRDYEDDAMSPLHAAGVRHVHLGRRRKTDVHRFGRLLRVLHRERIDILHAHMFGSNLWGSLIGRACRVPVVIAHEQTWSYEGQPLRRWLDGHVIGRLADRFVAVSTQDASRMVSVEGVSPEKVVMIPNAYIPRNAAAPSSLRAEIGISETTPLVASVAVLRPQKTLTVLLDAFATVRSAVPHAHLAIAGDGPCRAELEAHARALELTRCVHFLGRRNDVDAILRTADVMAMSSDFEGTPLVAYESIANGTPIVATAVGGLPDIIQDGTSGRLVPRRDPAALADAICDLLTDPAKRERFRVAAEERIDEFTLATATERFIALYDQLYAASGDRHTRARPVIRT